jgi:hypothetical protein
MTQAGVDDLKAFAQAGGTLVAINDATQLPIRAFFNALRQGAAG